MIVLDYIQKLNNDFNEITIDMHNTFHHIYIKNLRITLSG